MEMELKLNLFIVGLVITPILVSFIKPLRKKLNSLAEQMGITPAIAVVSVGLIFVFDIDIGIGWLNLAISLLGFVLFFINYAVALSAQELAKEHYSLKSRH